MTIQIALLALANSLRPSSFLAVYALVREHSPSRLLAAYVFAGLAFTLAVGAAVVLAFSGIDLQAGSGHTKGIAEIAAGIVIVAVGTGMVFRRDDLGRVMDAPSTSGRLGRLRERQITTRTAALAGPATHIPGLLYLAALNLIVSQEPDVPGSLLQVGIYNAIWFAPPIVALAVCIVDPSLARKAVQRLEHWGAAHARAIVQTVTFGVGGWLLVNGATTI
jgi:Sap, sulfolipid-1-addressing protein